MTGHLGRPGGKRVAKYSLKPVAKYYSKHLKKVTFIPELIGKKVNQKIQKAKPGDILVLENPRFYNGEKMNDQSFAKKLASLADIYINEDFGSSHRKQATTFGMIKHLPSFAGPALVHEVNILEKLQQKSKSPTLLIVGGSKVKTKLGLIRNFENKASKIALGGVIVNTILFKDAGIKMKLDKEEERALSILQKMIKRRKKILIPTDVVRKYPNGKTKIIESSKVTGKFAIIDIGSDSVDAIIKEMKKAKTIIWNGPVGLIEDKVGKKGNDRLLKSLKELNGEVYIGGGETVGMLYSMKLERYATFISTGGGAMLDFLAGKKLPTLEALKKY